MKLPDEMTIREAYGPAMELRSESEAHEYFEALVERSQRVFGNTREVAVTNEKSNLGYYAGYYDEATRQRVERLFLCAHPVFGPLSVMGQPSAEEALRLGEDSL